ncbi:hypothetical protein SAMN05660710_00906 [Paracoccus tibetensis]|uniref:Uncharacterized protein n=1 Tax=Paracoccus tibetensis TaxID=336292 RepID=A0A1G5DR02_9RHOB|nr:hypothetical protein SAMN05660710_00906 [Paracoccus tibetensis]
MAPRAYLGAHVGKHRTEIGPRAFIGSDAMLVAPVCVGTDAMTGSSGLAIRLMQALRTKKETR